MKRTALIWISVIVLLTAAYVYASKKAHAGANGGAKYGVANINPGESTTWSIAFDSNASAMARAYNYDNQDIDIFVYDSSNRLVASDTLTDSFPIANWTPTSPDIYKIVVKNCDTRSIATVRMETN